MHIWKALRRHLKNVQKIAHLQNFNYLWKYQVIKQKM